MRVPPPANASREEIVPAARIVSALKLDLLLLVGVVAKRVGRALAAIIVNAPLLKSKDVLVNQEERAPAPTASVQRRNLHVVKGESAAKYRNHSLTVR